MSNSLTALSKVPSNELASRMGALIRYFRSRPGTNQREGQLLMNALSTLDPDLAKVLVIEYPEADCFYDDSKIPAFFELMFPQGMS